MGNKSSAVTDTSKTESEHESALQSDLQMQLQAEHQFALLAQTKERKRREHLAFEEQLAAQMEKEAHLTLSSKQQQAKLLHDVADSQKQLDKQLVDIHQKQEQGRQKLAEELYKAEVKLQSDITNFLTAANEEAAKTRVLLQQGEEQFQTFLSVKKEDFNNLKKTSILVAMEEELARSLENAHSKRIHLPVNLVESHDEAISEVVRSRQKGQAELVMKLATEEALQQQAFASLLAKRDQLSHKLQTDITSIVSRLNQLTSLEVQKQQQKSNSSTVALSEMRVQLAVLLSQLLQQQECRKQDLQRLLKEMEKQRQLQVKDYWLLQYQRLMDSMLVFDEDPFAQPSAPPAWEEPSAPCEDNEPSAPPSDLVFVEADCVICMDRRCQVVFIPCGHVCCCSSCDSSVALCPLCRVDIERKLQI